MSTDSRFFPSLAMPSGTAGQVLTKNSNDPDNGATWADPQAGTGPVGPAGPQGPVGPAGSVGTPGSQILTGTGAPSGGTGSVNDFYLDSVTNSVYQKTGPTTWTFVAQLGDPEEGVAEQYGASLTSGCITTPNRPLGTSSSGYNNGVVILSYFRAPKSFTTTQIRAWSLSGPSGGTLSHVQLGLYSVATNGDLTLLAATADDPTVFASAGSFLRSWTGGGKALTKGSWYAFGFIVVQSAGTLPGVYSGNTSGFSALLGSVLPRLAGLGTGGTALPSSIVNGSIGATNAIRYYAEILP